MTVTMLPIKRYSLWLPSAQSPTYAYFAYTDDMKRFDVQTAPIELQLDTPILQEIV